MSTHGSGNVFAGTQLQANELLFLWRSLTVDTHLSTENLQKYRSEQRNLTFQEMTNYNQHENQYFFIFYRFVKDICGKTMTSLQARDLLQYVIIFIHFQVLIKIRRYISSETIFVKLVQIHCFGVIPLI